MLILMPAPHVSRRVHTTSVSDSLADMLCSVPTNQLEVHIYLRHQAPVYWNLLVEESQTCWVGDEAGDQQWQQCGIHGPTLCLLNNMLLVYTGLVRLNAFGDGDCRGSAGACKQTCNSPTTSSKSIRQLLMDSY